MASQGHPTDDRPAELHTLTALGRLWLSGISVDWNRFQGHQPRREALPLLEREHAI